VQTRSSAEGSREFAAASPTALVQAHEFPPLYHEIFNELEPDGFPGGRNARSMAQEANVNKGRSATAALAVSLGLLAALRWPGRLVRR
jgi:hypothetical protein